MKDRFFFIFRVSFLLQLTISSRISEALSIKLTLVKTSDHLYLIGYILIEVYFMGLYLTGNVKNILYKKGIE